ncbi:hypothetical protein QYE76_056451 [Lolium multiflorum]|uniref:Homeobox-leucine zipper protein n=1 Tax=Lolium multiflorum TaxID=4521 RepID=A0AAD8T1M3_LOLMU|nr:hypothetical protein QYE76_056451 [Lolium multiflorum]
MSDDGSHLGGEKKLRLNVEQVGALEKNFKLANKLEPNRKMQLARAGLQPRHTYLQREAMSKVSSVNGIGHQVGLFVWEKLESVQNASSCSFRCIICSHTIHFGIRSMFIIRH